MGFSIKSIMVKDDMLMDFSNFQKYLYSLPQFIKNEESFRITNQLYVGRVVHGGMGLAGGISVDIDEYQSINEVVDSASFDVGYLLGKATVTTKNTSPATFELVFLENLPEDDIDWSYRAYKEDNIAYENFDRTNTVYFKLYKYSKTTGMLEDLRFVDARGVAGSGSFSYDDFSLTGNILSLTLSGITKTVDLSSLQLTGILPNSCPPDSNIISSVNDILSATDLGGTYCLQGNITLDTTIHGVIDGFYGDINLNGYSINHVGDVPFTNFKGKLHQGIVNSTIIDNVTSDNDGVQIPTFQNLSLNSKIFKSCNCIIYLYGVITTTSIGSVNSNNISFELCKLPQDFFTGTVTNVIVSQSEINLKYTNSNSYAFTKLEVSDCKFKINYEESIGVVNATGDSISLLHDVPLGSTLTINNVIVTGKYTRYDSDSGASAIIDSYINLNQSRVSGTLNINNYVVLLSDVTIGQNVTPNIITFDNYPTGVGVVNIDTILYLSTMNITGVSDKYNTTPSFHKSQFVKEYIDKPTYGKGDITVDNFKAIGFDENIWDLELINNGYIPNLKNGAAFQQKEKIEDLPEIEEV